MKKFKLTITVDGDPGVSREETGSHTQIVHRIMDFSTKAWYSIANMMDALELDDELIEMTIRKGSINYRITKI